MTKRLSYLSITLILPLLLAAILIFSGRAQAGGPDVCASGCSYSTIQAALNDDATVGTTLVLAGETFIENVEITRSISLVGAGPSLTIIDGNLTDTAVLISGSPTVSISEVTIRNGDASLDGGGVLNEGGTVTLSNVVVEDNLAIIGAGITNNGTMILDGVIVRNNVADEIIGGTPICGDCAGGGIYNLSVMTITNSTIHGNTAQFGGGIENANDSIIVADGVQVYGNTAENSSGDPSAGGGIENLGTMTLTNSIVRNNNAPFGAGIATDGMLTISNSDIYSNIASTRGGGIHNLFNLTVQTSNIYSNQAGTGGGGGISSESGDVVVTQTAVYSNSAQFGGGIIHNVIAGTNSFVITNSTLSGNNALGTGGALHNEGNDTSTTLNNVTINNNTATVVAGQSISVDSGTITATNSIISSSSTDCSGNITSNGYNLVSDSSCGLNGTADLINANPQLGPLQDNGGSTLTHALLTGSPAINSGNNSDCPAVDQRGVTRPVGTTCDRGAYESEEVSLSVYLPFVVKP